MSEKRKTPITERMMISALHWHLSNAYRVCVPRARIFFGEVDFLGVRQSGRIDAFEIKVSRSDFRRDREKVFWHKILQGKFTDSYKRPNRFWYAAPKSLIPVSEVPEYAGLVEIEFRPNGLTRYEETKKAPVLTSEKPSEKTIWQALTCMHWRYWSQFSDLTRAINSEVFRREQMQARIATTD